MVLRKPTLVDSPLSASSLSPLPPRQDKLISGSDEVSTSPQTTRGPSVSPYPQSTSSPVAHVESSQSLLVDVRRGDPYIKDEAANAARWPSAGRAGEAPESLHLLYPELPGNMMPGPSTGGKATPRSSLDSGGSREFGEEVISKQGESSTMTHLQQSSRPYHMSPSVPEVTAASIPPQTSTSHSSDGISPDLFRSSNPFRQATSSGGIRPESKHSLYGDLEFRSERRDASPDVGASFKMSANLSPADRPFSEYSTSYRPSTLDLDTTFPSQGNEQDLQMAPTWKSAQNSCPPPLDEAILDGQEPLIPVATECPLDTRIHQRQSRLSSSENGPIQVNKTTESSVRPGLFNDLQKELPMRPQKIDPPLMNFHTPARSLSVIPDQRAASSEGTTCKKSYSQESSPPESENLLMTRSSRIVEAELAKLRAQRNETYSIKHFNWICPTSRTLRRSSMLVQNQNGPCPLLALVNALILGAETDSRSVLGATLWTREQVSLGLIIESLMDELTSEGRGGILTELPDVDELNRFLLLLHTGMTANPKLAVSTNPSSNLMDARNSSLHLPLSLHDDNKPGTFEDTQDMRLYRAFAVPLVHGWLAPRPDPARAAFARSAPTYEDAQTIQFREEELEDKLSHSGLTEDEAQLLQDISSIKSFLINNPSQITSYGLRIVNESIFPGAFAILFRNDHFSTIYKHPESGQLFTLVTDAGYSDKDEVIWESLVDVSGNDSGFFSGDFRPVGNTDTNSQLQQTQRGSPHVSTGPPHSTSSLGLLSPTSPQEQQQQADADFAMALQLQEEEEARMDESVRHSDVNGSAPNRVPVNNNHRPREQEGSRPAIPPRNTRNQGVNRPTDPNLDEAPPPAYEEAAKVRPYLPPLGHPQHPSFDGRSPTCGHSTPIPSPGPRAAPSPPNRMSAFQESSRFHSTPPLHSSPPLTRQQTNNSLSVGQHSGRSRDREKDCIVM